MNKKGGIFAFVVFLIIVLVVGFFWFVNNYDTLDEEVVNESCVAATCCHPTECVLASEAPNCSNIACTEICETGSLDCGQGSCEYINGGCEAVFNE